MMSLVLNNRALVFVYSVNCIVIVVLHFRGLFLSINDKGHLYSMVCNWPENDVRVSNNMIFLHAKRFCSLW